MCFMYSYSFVPTICPRITFGCGIHFKPGVFFVLSRISNSIFLSSSYKKRLELDGLTAKSFRWVFWYFSFTTEDTLDTTLLTWLFSCRLRGLGMNLPGAYRKLVAAPTDLFWKYVEDAHACTANITAGHSIAQTGSRPADSGIKRARIAVNDCYEDEGELSVRFASNTTELTKVERDCEQCCNDVEISFSLEPSCYATSCIRELLKSWNYRSCFTVTPHEALNVIHYRYHILDIIDTDFFDTIRYCSRDHLEEAVRCVFCGKFEELLVVYYGSCWWISIRKASTL